MRVEEPVVADGAWYDREAVSEESPVRPRGNQNALPRYDPEAIRTRFPGTTPRPSARSPRYDREAVSDPSQTATVRERT